ncbi:MAG: DUF3592 domain-containing protein [Pseudomonadota bacterium]
MKARLFMTLFALPFFGVGVFMLYLVGAMLLDASRVSGWIPTEATLVAAGYETHAGDDSNTYEAYATYRYQYDFASYTGNRVSLSGGGDNLGDHQQELGRRLAASMARNESITVYVNPDDPREAIVDRTLRWGLLGFKSIFVLVFGGVGLGLLIAAWRAPAEKDRSDSRYADAPWLMNDDWQTESIRSDSRGAMWGAWIFAGFWNAVSAPLPFLLVDEVMNKQNYVALVGLLFPIIGAGLLVWAVRRTLEWRRFGRTPVVLDPFPGSIGGHVGGTVDLPVPFSSSTPYRVTLTSLSSYVTGSGKNRRRTEKALWQDELIAHAESSMRGTRVSFRFDVPDGLKASDADPEGDSYKLWRLNLSAELEGTDLNRDFEIPVYPTGKQSRRLSDRSVRASNEVSDAAQASALRDVVRVTSEGMAKRLVYPMGRNLLSNSIGLLVGLSFAFAGGWIALEEGALVFGAIFGGVGALVAVLAFYMMFKSLEVIREGNTIRSVRRFLGIPVSRREMQVGDVYRLEKDSGMQTQSGGKHTVFYRITAIDRNANEMLLGEGFRGESGAKAAEIFLIRELGIV